jgi:hypothetical protein
VDADAALVHHVAAQAARDRDEHGRSGDEHGRDEVRAAAAGAEDGPLAALLRGKGLNTRPSQATPALSPVRMAKCWWSDKSARVVGVKCALRSETTPAAMAAMIATHSAVRSQNAAR